MHWNICGSDNILGKYSSETLATMIFICIFAISNTVRLVQLVEHQIVVLGVVGSSPTSHPSKKTGLYRSSFLIILLEPNPVTELVEVATCLFITFSV